MSEKSENGSYNQRGRQVERTSAREQARRHFKQNLLKPGRKYEQAVKAFEPYDQIKEENPAARAAGTALIREGQSAGPKRKTFLYVNNRLEGNALSTIVAMIDALGR